MEQNPHIAYESQPSEYAPGDVVEIKRDDQFNPHVVMRDINEHFLGTSEIVNRDGILFLGLEGTAHKSDVTKTSARWTIEEIVKAYCQNFDYDPNDLTSFNYMKNVLFPDSTQA